MPAPYQTLKNYTARFLTTMARKSEGVESDTSRSSEYQEMAFWLGMQGGQVLAHDDVVRVATMQPGATALQLGLSASFNSAQAAFAFQNGDANLAGSIPKQCIPLFFKCTVSGAPTTATNWRFASVIDTSSRLPTTISGVGSPGTPATATCYLPSVVGTNTGTKGASVGKAYFPLSVTAGAPIAVPAHSADPSISRYLEGNGLLRIQIPVVGDEYWIAYGDLDLQAGQLTTAASAGYSKIVHPHPAIEIAPQTWHLLHMWGASNATAGIIFDSMTFAWIER